VTSGGPSPGARGKTPRFGTGDLLSESNLKNDKGDCGSSPLRKAVPVSLHVAVVAGEGGKRAAVSFAEVHRKPGAQTPEKRSRRGRLRPRRRMLQKRGDRQFTKFPTVLKRRGGEEGKKPTF